MLNIEKFQIQMSRAYVWGIHEKKLKLKILPEFFFIIIAVSDVSESGYP